MMCIASCTTALALYLKATVYARIDIEVPVKILLILYFYTSSVILGMKFALEILK
jgi:hypothetical protein